MKLCDCGCGLAAPIAKRTKSTAGHTKGQPTRYRHGHNRRRAPSTIDTNGYEQTRLVPDRFSSMRDAGGYTLVHRLVMAQWLGRPLQSSEYVHHINGDRRDNRLSNLQIVSRSEHTRIHAPGAIRWRRRGEVVPR